METMPKLKCRIQKTQLVAVLTKEATCQPVQAWCKGPRAKIWSTTWTEGSYQMRCWRQNVRIAPMPLPPIWRPIKAPICTINSSNRLHSTTQCSYRSIRCRTPLPCFNSTSNSIMACLPTSNIARVNKCSCLAIQCICHLQWLESKAFPTIWSVNRVLHHLEQVLARWRLLSKWHSCQACNRPRWTPSSILIHRWCSLWWTRMLCRCSNSNRNRPPTSCQIQESLKSAQLIRPRWPIFKKAGEAVS